MLEPVVILALVIGLVLAVRWGGRIVEETKNLKESNAALARQVEALNTDKTAHDELLAAWAEKITARVEALSPDDLARLDGLLRAKLPEAIEAVLARPSRSFLEALRAKVEPHAEAVVTAALKDSDGEMGKAVLQSIRKVLGSADHPAWQTALESLQAPLCDRLVRLAVNPPPALAAQIDDKIGQALQQHVDHIFANPDDHADLVETINETLGNRITRVADHLPAPVASQIDQKVGEALVTRIDAMFAEPGEHESVFEAVDVALGDRITTVAENPPEELAARMDQRIGDELVGAMHHIFENPDDYESVFETVVEQLGERIGRLAESPSDETAERLDAAVAEGLISQTHKIFDNLGDHAELAEDVTGRLILRIRARLEQELSDGSRGGLDNALDELLRGQLTRRFQQTDLAALDRLIDGRLKAAVDKPPPEMLALVDRMFQDKLMTRARERLGEKIRDCEEELESVLLYRLQARIRALPQEGCPAVDELIDLKLPGWFAERLGESFQVNDAVNRQVAVRVEGWIGSALDQPKAVLKNALENWITHQVLSALKANPVGAETSQV